jgi:hypothetical protein
MPILAGKEVGSLSKAQSEPLSGTVGLHFWHLEHVERVGGTSRFRPILEAWRKKKILCAYSI